MKTARFGAFLLLFLLAVAFLPARQPRYPYPFQNPVLSIDERVDNVISLLTLDEKIAALGTGAISRLNIPNPGGAEGIHQLVVRAGRGAGQGTPPGAPQAVPTTSFAQVYGMGETWDPDLIHRAGAVVGYEARYITQSDKYKRVMLTVWGPTSDMARDPRWGRTDESFGEDPFLTGTMAVAYARGIQGDDPKYWQVMAKLKHLFANSNENTRTSSSSDFDERLMREYYAVPFRRAFLEAGVKGYMSAYNAWNGVPMVVNPVLKNVVSREWGADWNVSPDAGALGHVVDGHHYYKTMDDVYVNALKVGVNNLGGGGFGRAAGPPMPDVMKQALADGRISESDIDAAIKGRFRTVIKLGLLDPPAMNPYARIGAAGEPEPWTTDSHRTVAREVARESVVLLKNSRSLLPLSRQSMKSIAVIGPRAGNVLSDFYTGTTPYSVSVLQGIRNIVGSGTTVNYSPTNDNDAAVTSARSSDVAVVVVGNDPMCGSANPGEAFNPDGSTKPCGDPGEGREGRDRESLNLAPDQEKLIEQVLAANPKTIVVLVSSFPYAINWVQQNVPAILHITHTAQDQGTAVADVLFGDYNPSGRLVQTWPTSVDQLPPFMDYDIRRGRTYLYFKGKPLYPFGYGLGYSTFAYSNLRLSSSRLPRNGAITVSVDVKNTGRQDGAEVVELYVQHTQSKVTRPIKELKGFRRVALKANETRTVQIPLTAASLAWWNEQQHDFEVESEPIRILIGRSSAEVNLQGTLTVD